MAEARERVTAEQLTAWAALTAAATPGPWECARAGAFNSQTQQFDIGEYFVRQPGGDMAIAADVADPESGEPSRANAAFIAAAREAVPALVAEVERLREEGVALTLERDALRAQADAFRAERDQLASERGSFYTSHNMQQKQIAALIQERDALKADAALGRLIREGSYTLTSEHTYECLVSDMSDAYSTSCICHRDERQAAIDAALAKAQEATP